jgi:hypothetical protein
MYALKMELLGNPGAGVNYSENAAVFAEVS